VTSLDAAAEVLLERVAGRELTAERLELAAYAGDEVAREAFARRSGAVAPPAELEPWLDGLARWGREAGLRAVAALAEQAVAGWRPAPGRLRDLAAATGDWCLDPARRDLAELVVGLARKAAGKAAARPGARRPEASRAVLVQHAAAFACAGHGAGDLRAVAALATGRLEDLRGAVRGALVPWALGAEDPLAARRRDAVRAATEQISVAAEIHGVELAAGARPDGPWGNPHHFRRRALALLGLGEAVAAREDLARALELTPDESPFAEVTRVLLAEAGGP